MTDFRALCAELLAHAKKAQSIAAQDLWFGDEDDGLFGRADTALAAPELQPVAEESSVAEPAALAEQPVGAEVEPTLREEFTMILNEARCNSLSRIIGNIELGRRLVAVVKQFKHPTPIPATERLPGPEDLNGILEECWWYDHACWYLDTYQANYTHWLPANALPLPSND